VLTFRIAAEALLKVAEKIQILAVTERLNSTDSTSLEGIICRFSDGEGDIYG